MQLRRQRGTKHLLFIGYSSELINSSSSLHLQRAIGLNIVLICPQIVLETEYLLHFFWMFFLQKLYLILCSVYSKYMLSSRDVNVSIFTGCQNFGALATTL